jgi:hypothetical protein
MRDAFLRVFRIGQIVQRHRAADADRLIVLRDLVIFRHVRIEIILRSNLQMSATRQPSMSPVSAVILQRGIIHHGSAPGIQGSPGRLLAFASEPNPTGHPQNILLRVLS